MSDEWIGTVHSTMPKYMKGASDLTKRKRLLLALLNKKGRFEYNQSGDEMKWQIEISQPPMETYDGHASIDFSAHDAFRQLTTGWRGYILRDALSKKDKEMNKGNQALINLFQTKQNRLMKSARNNFCGELYKDGGSAGRENAIEGCETFMGTGTTVAADRLAKPDDSYAGLDTDVAALGGSWSANLTTFPNANIATDWPDGQGDSEYDAMSPKLGNWSSTNWGTGSQTWEDNCWLVISQMITWLTLTGDADGMPDIAVMAGNLFQGYKNHMEAKQRIVVPHKTASDLGFEGNQLNQDGCILSADFDCPVNTGYMFNTSFITISSLMPDLFWMEGPDKVPEKGWAHVWGTGFFGNVKWQPKHTGKFKNFAS